MTDPKTEFELDYWRKAPAANHPLRYRAILDAWGFHGAESVIEVGTGPLGGVLPYIEAVRKVGLDPLYAIYRAAGLLVEHPGIEYVTSPIEALGPDFTEQFAVAVSMNALDHGESDFSSIERIGRLLQLGGRFYLHVHLRRPDQLNVGHDHALQIEDLVTATEAAGLRQLWRAIYDKDPIEGGAYSTVIGVWEK